MEKEAYRTEWRIFAEAEDLAGQGIKIGRTPIIYNAEVELCDS